MLKKMLIVAVSLMGAQAIAQSASLDVASLNCGGLASLTKEKGRYFVNIRKVGESTCTNLEIPDLKVKGDMQKDGSSVDVSALRGKIAFIVDGQIVIFDRAAAEAVEAQMIAAQAQSRVVQRIDQQQRAAQTQQNIENGLVVGGAAIDAAGAVADSIER